MTAGVKMRNEDVREQNENRRMREKRKITVKTGQMP